ncbi:MAG: tetratricopeptide repeat protein [Pseudomonadota bacterium]
MCINNIKALLFCASVLLLSACNSDDKPTSLADIDVSTSEDSENKVFIKPKSEEEIRSAYTNYLKSAGTDDNTRLEALSRLAELEFSYSDKLLQQQENLNQDEKDAFDDRLYNSRLNKTIDLLSTSLKDYPESKNNDTLLYQIAKAYDQRGDHQDSVDALTELVDKYPKSPFYAEAQFRIAEDAFSYQDYSTAEFSYTEVITAKNNDVFYEKSLFKRGWSRFKQQYYTDAVDDFLQAVLEHEFDEFEKLDKSETDQFNEYFRAVGLAFSYLGGSESLDAYFKDQPDFIYTYHTYSMVSKIYLKQERYSDAVDTHKQFIKLYPRSNNIPYSHLKIIEIWKNSGFTQKVYDAIEGFYIQYNPSSIYWKNQNEKSSINRAIRRSLKEYVVLMTGYYHNKYQKTAKTNDFKRTELWYKRYLKHYSAYAQQDNVYFLYAELLSQKLRYKEALKYYELAAYDNELIIHKKAAYASILISDKLLRKNIKNKTYLKKHISYALKYAQKYPKDKQTHQIILHAAELAFKAGKYKNTIELADILLTNQNQNSNNNYISSLKAESYFKLKEYAESELLFMQLVQSRQSSAKEKKRYRDKLALSIYKQGDVALSNKDTPQAINHYSRISSIAAASTIAATGLYDAIALNMQHKQWHSAISDIKRFQQLYPRNKLQPDVSKKLSVAYLSSNQGIKAAAEFEKISSMGGNLALKSAALWQAAELYEEKNKLNDAIRSYEEYARKFKKPYPQYIESMNKLTELYTKKGSLAKTIKWRKKIIKTDKRALNNAKTDRTKYITSFAYLGLARYEKSRFDKISLTLPLRRSLKKKKSAMQSSVRYYGNASKYKIYEAATEATYSIALIYKDFSISLLESDRPTKLNAEELDQYEILLEDQAFPFEDKSIEFFEINLSRVKDGHYNKWIKKSHQQLTGLFPTRYNRKPKEDSYINVLH